MTSHINGQIDWLVTAVRLIALKKEETDNFLVLISGRYFTYIISFYPNKNSWEINITVLKW